MPASMKFSLSCILLLLCLTCMSQPDETYSLGNDIRVTRISPHCYLHVSWSSLPGYGRFASNGVIFTDGKNAFLFDTPVSDSLTAILVSWIGDSLKLHIAAFVPNHWHSDCMGGLAYLKKKGIVSYANEITREFARQNKLPEPDHTFRDSLVLNAGPHRIVCYYPGPAHTADNIVVWIPSEKVLFGGCMVKDLQAATLGNTADASVSTWPSTIRNVQAKFPDARIVVPGHGQPGDISLLSHTLMLLNNSQP
jgi:metallo-beta-lactamase class B